MVADSPDNPARAARYARDLEARHHAGGAQGRAGGLQPQPHPRPGLVDEVDGLVRQEAVGDVAVGQLGRRHQRQPGDVRHGDDPEQRDRPEGDRDEAGVLDREDDSARVDRSRRRRAIPGSPRELLLKWLIRKRARAG